MRTLLYNFSIDCQSSSFFFFPFECTNAHIRKTLRSVEIQRSRDTANEMVQGLFKRKKKTGVLQLSSIYLSMLTCWQLLPFISEWRHHTPGPGFQMAARFPPRDATWTDAAMSIGFNKAGWWGLFALGVSSRGKTGGLLINMALVPKQNKLIGAAAALFIWMKCFLFCFLYRKPISPDSNLHSNNTFVYMGFLQHFR